MQVQHIRIGTRGSALAMAQAREVRARLMAAHGWPEDAIEIKAYTTSGDVITDRPLSEVGGKGLFTKEIEAALIATEVDIAVHSMKDMQTILPPGLVIGAVLPREDVRDAFISLKYASLDTLPEGAVVGTSSLRRQAQVKRARPDLTVIDFRGNVETRLRKLKEGVADATFLACAGLKRLGLADRITAPVPADVMVPAVAQAAIAIEIREDDDAAARIVAPLNDEPSARRIMTERAFLRRLEGSCRTAIAGLAEIEGDRIRFVGMTFSTDGSVCLETERTGSINDAAQIGEAAADDLLKRGAAALIRRPA